MRSAQLISSHPQTLWFTWANCIPLAMLTGWEIAIWPKLVREPSAGSVEKKKFSFCWEPSCPHREEAVQRMKATQKEAEQTMFKDKFLMKPFEHLHELILSFFNSTSYHIPPIFHVHFWMLGIRWWTKGRPYAPGACIPVGTPGNKYQVDMEYHASSW